jgi:hypothetical protein
LEVLRLTQSSDPGSSILVSPPPTARPQVSVAAPVLAVQVDRETPEYE